MNADKDRINHKLCNLQADITESESFQVGINHDYTIHRIILYRRFVFALSSLYTKTFREMHYNIDLKCISIASVCSEVQLSFVPDPSPLYCHSKLGLACQNARTASVILCPFNKACVQTQNNSLSTDYFFA